MNAPAYCCCRISSVALANDGTNTVIRVDDLFNRDSSREQSICSVAGFSRSEKIAIIGLLINFHTESATVILQQIFFIESAIWSFSPCNEMYRAFLIFEINDILNAYKFAAAMTSNDLDKQNKHCHRYFLRLYIFNVRFNRARCALYTLCTVSTQ